MVAQPSFLSISCASLCWAFPAWWQSLLSAVILQPMLRGRVFTSMIILGFYAVVAGWCLQYLYASIMAEVQGDANFVKEYFASFSSDAVRPTLWTIAFILLTHVVVVKGVRNGIERASKILMPLLFVLLVVLVVASCSLQGAWKGVEFLLKPDFSKVDPNVMIEALGQAFFSLSLGTACLCTYASYFSRQTNLLKTATQIAFLDTLIAILAGLMIFPAAFSVGVQPDSGPSLIFITLPNVFNEAFASMPVVGYVISVLFYALLVLAALTSTISMHEIGTAFFYEEMHISRRGGAWIETVACCVIGVSVPSVLRSRYACLSPLFSPTLENSSPCKKRTPANTRITANTTQKNLCFILNTPLIFSCEVLHRADKLPLSSRIVHCGLAQSDVTVHVRLRIPDIRTERVQVQG